MGVARPIDLMIETPEYDCLGWSTDEELDHSLRQDTGISWQGGLCVVG